MKIHVRICLELTGWGKGRQLEVNALTGIVVFAAVGAPTLLLLVLLIVENLDQEGAFRSAVLNFLAVPLTRGGHG